MRNERIFQSVEDLSASKKKVIMVGILILSLLQNFNSNMFNVAGAAIVAELSGVQYYTLQFTLFQLISGIFIPIFGTLGDLQGRRRWLSVGAAAFIAGEVIIGFANTMMVVMVGRIIVSIAQGVVSANQLAFIGELANEKERPMFMAIYNAGTGIALIFAPILAGAFVDLVSWRMVFYFLAILSLVVALFIMKAVPPLKTAAMQKGEKKSVDWGGGLSLAVFGLAFLLVFTWAPSEGWTSPALIGLYVLIAVSLVLFVVFEKKVKNPMVPFFLFRYRSFTMGLLAMVFYGPACFSFSTYTAQVGVGVMGLNATVTGSFVTVHAVGYLISTFLTGKLISAKGPRSLKPVQIVCLCGLGAAVFSLTLITPQSSVWTMYAILALGGFFNAPLIVGFTQILQKEVPREYIGMGSALLQFMMKLGGAFGIAVGGLLMSSGWSSGVGAVLGTETAASLGGEITQALSSSGTLLSAASLSAVRDMASTSMLEAFDTVVLSLRQLLGTAVGRIFWLCFITMVCSIVLICFVKNVKEEETEPGAR